MTMGAMGKPLERAVKKDVFLTPLPSMNTLEKRKGSFMKRKGMGKEKENTERDFAFKNIVDLFHL